MKNKKTLQLAVAFMLSCPMYSVNAATHYQMIWGGEANNVKTGDTIDVTANTTFPQMHGVYANGGNTTDVSHADNVTVKTAADAGDAIRTNPANSGSTANIVIGSGWTIEVYGDSADGVNLNGYSTFTAGDNLTIKVTGSQGSGNLYNDAFGLRTNMGNKIVVGKNLDISTTHNSSHAIYITGNVGNDVKIGSGSKILTNGESAYAVNISGQNSKFNAESGANWETKGDTAHVISMTGAKAEAEIGSGSSFITNGSGSHAVLLTANEAKVKIGAAANIVTKKDESYGVAVYKESSAKGTVENGTVILGSGSKITTEGKNSHGVFVNMTGSVLSLEDNIGIKTKNDGSHGLFAEEGTIEVGNGLDISVEGSGAHGVFTNGVSGGIDLLGGATINTNNNDGYAVYADAGTITGTAGNSTFNITGNMLADNGGAINLEMDNNSVFTGNTALANSGIINLSLMDNSVWHVTSSSEVSDLHVSGNSMVNLSHEAGMDTVVTIDNLNGTGGVFQFNTDLDSETFGDKLVVNSADAGGTHYVQVRDISLINGEVTGEKKLHIITDNSNNAAFTGRYMNTGGLWNVLPTVVCGDTVGESANEWYLTKIEKQENGNTETINDGFASDYSLWRATNDTMRKRLGDIRSGEHGSDGVWARMYHGKLKGQSYTDNYHTYQLGYDKTTYNDKNAQRTNGIVLERSEGKLSYTAGKGETGLTALGLYTTWFGNKGHYTDIVLRAGHLDHKMNTYGEYAERSDYDNAAYSISFEYGRQKNYEKGWFFTPQAQITFGRMNSVDFTTERGTKVNVDGLTSAIGRIGFEVGRKISPESSYYFKLGAFHEFDGDRDVSMMAANGESLRKSYDNGDSWYEFGMGAQVQLSRNTHFYGDIERSFGGDTKKEWQVNAGIRWEF